MDNKQKVDDFNMLDKEIKKVFLHCQNIHPSESFLLDSKNGKIKKFSVNGEMAPVVWFRQGNQEINGKYVEMVIYED